MIEPLSDPALLRRMRRALRRMSRRQAAIFIAMRDEQPPYAELAERHGITIAEVEAEFAAGLTIFLASLEEPDRWLDFVKDIFR